MYKNMEFVSVNPNAFKKEVYKKNHNLVSLSAELGYCNNYLGNYMMKEKLPLRVAKMIDALLGIPMERYVVKKEESQPIVQVIEPTPASGIGEEQLYNIIYNAVYNAMKRALEE